MTIKDLFLANENLYLGISSSYGNAEWAGCRAIVRKDYKGVGKVMFEPYDDEGNNYKDGEISLSQEDVMQLNNAVAVLSALLNKELKAD